MIYFCNKYYLGVEIKTILILLLFSYSYGVDLHVPEYYQTIQLAIDSAISGDEILVASGIYNERIDFKGKNISIIGENKDNTIIDGSEIDYLDLVTINSGENIDSTLFKNFTIQGFAPIIQGSSALVINNNSGAVLDSIHIINNNSPGNAPAIYINDNSYVKISNSIISDNSNLDNLIQIAHNVRIGTHAVIAAQVGIAGSTIIGDYVKIGGQAGISGHLSIGNNVTIAAKSGVTKNIKDSQVVAGFPAIDIKKWKKNIIKLNKKNEN